MTRSYPLSVRWPSITEQRILTIRYLDFWETGHNTTWNLQKSELAPPPPESPPPKRTSGLPVCGATACGDNAPITADPAFIHSLSLPERRSAVKPWRIPPGDDASQRRIKSATPINNMPKSIGSQVCRGQPR